MGANEFAIKSFESWLSGLGEIYNYHVLDMFEWEQGHGNWLAMCQLEFDIAWKDLFTPFNCRRLLINFLSVNEKYRSYPKFELYRNLIMKLWPELLNVPINPHYKTRLRIVPLLKGLIPHPIKRNIKKILSMES
jgi:hypothetical protein